MTGISGDALDRLFGFFMEVIDPKILVYLCDPKLIGEILSHLQERDRKIGILFNMILEEKAVIHFVDMVS
jgi:hypothetical protein